MARRPQPIMMKLVSLALAAAAVAWAVVVVRQALQADDGGPPLGAMCMGVPAVALLAGAGAAWPRRTAEGDL